MSVPVGKRNKNKFEAIVKAQALVKHILLITKNEKIFDISYKALIEDINHCAERVYINAYTANNIYAKSKESYEQRIRLETDAILECKSLLALMDLAWQLFHLSSKKVQYACKLTIEAEQSIQAWRKSDREKLKKIT